MNRESVGFLVFAGLCLGVAIGMLAISTSKLKGMDGVDLTASLQACEQARDRLMQGSIYDYDVSPLNGGIRYD